MAIYRRQKKHPGRMKILASAQVSLPSGVPCKLVFVRDRCKGDWLAILHADIIYQMKTSFVSYALTGLE